MRQVATIALNCVLLFSPAIQSFSPPSLRRADLFGTRKHVRTIVPSFAQMSTSEDANSSRRRRKRKDGKNSEMTDEERESVEALQIDERRTLKPEPVQLKVQDIRNLASGNSEQVITESKLEVKDQGKDDDRSDSLVSVGMSNTNDNSLEALLADAKRIRESEASKSSESDEPSIPKAIKSAISTIVTVDFFVVCGLLAWFLAGIFCSYVLKDDAVQIAFNGIFEPVVQPALGILMIGSAAGAAFGDPKKES